MASVSTYLNFNGQTEAAFTHYAKVFAAPAPQFTRMGDAPPPPGYPALSDDAKQRVMHVEMEILGGHKLMGSDVPDSHKKVVHGTGMYVSLTLDSRGETDRLFAGLAEGGTVETKLQEMFWGDYWGTCIDQYGIQWMFSSRSKS